MAVIVRVSVLAPDDILTEYGAGAVVRVESSATESGVYAEISPTATIPVVAKVFSYELPHPTGSTTTWYRTRYSDSGDTNQSAYSDPFSPGAPEAYADLDDLLRTMAGVPADTKFLANAEQRLRDATNDLIREIGYSYFRSPRSGADEVREFTVGHDGVIHAHEGIVSIESARIRTSTSADFEAMDVADLRLEYWARGDHASSKPATEPWDHVALTGRGTLLTWPRTVLGVEFTGAYLWPSRDRGRQACIAWARQKLGADPSVPGGAMGPDGYGSPMGPNAWPRPVYDLLMSERRRFIECST